MSSTTYLPTAKRKNLFGTILLTGLLAGTLDIIAAMLKFYIEQGRGPAPIFKFIASGIFGREAFSSGNGMILWGIVFHFLIAICFTGFLFLLYPFIKKILNNKWAIAVIYGLFVWFVMNRLVLPLSNTPPPKGFDIADASKQGLILVTMIGLPVALIADRYYYGNSIRR